MATLFEAPFAAENPGHELGTPETMEFGMHEAAAFEDEFGAHEFGAHEFGAHEFGAHEFGAHEFGAHEGAFEGEFGAHALGAHEFGAHEFGAHEFEADPFLGKAFRRFSRAALRRLGKIAKGAAPFVAGKLFGMIPGAGLIAGPLAAKLTAALVREGEVSTLEAE